MNPLYTAWLAFMGVIAVFFMYYVMLQNKRTQLSKLKTINQRLEMELDDAKTRVKKLRKDEASFASQAQAILAASEEARNGQARIKKKRVSLTNVLLQSGIISSEQVAAALEEQQTRSPDKRVEEILVSMGFVSKDQLMKAVEKAKAIQRQQASGNGGKGSSVVPEEAAAS